MLDTYTATAITVQPEPTSYALGNRFVLRRRERLLQADGEPAELGSRAVEVLLALVEADGALLTKGALLDRVWPDVVVEENNLQVQVSAIRRALRPDGRDWIATVPGRGYRFVGPVTALAEGQGAIDPRETVRQPAAAEPPRLSVIVLPFASRGEDPAQDCFAGAVTDGLTTDLARALPPGSSAVVAQATAKTYKGHPADVRAIGREQAVRYVVEGSVLLSGDQVRVNAQLVAAETGVHVWAERFDTPRSDALQVQDQIVGRLARAVRLQMIGAEARRAEQAEHEHPDESTAQDYVLRARTAATRLDLMTRSDVAATCGLYARALERDPANADALAGIAWLRVHQVAHGCLDETTGWTVRDEKQAREAGLAEAEEKLARALAIAPGNLAALKGRAMLLRARGLFADAIAAAETVLARNPGEPMTHREIGLNLLYLGRAEEAVDWLRRTDALAPGDDPLRWTWLQGLGRALVQLGRDREAVEALRLAVASNATYAPSHAFLAAALALVGDDTAARAAIAAFRRAEPDTPLEVLAQRSAVPLGTTDPLYNSASARLLEGLRRAADLAAA